MDKNILDSIREKYDRLTLAGDTPHAVFCSTKGFKRLCKVLTMVSGKKVVEVTDLVVNGMIVEINEYMADDQFLVVNKEVWKLIKHVPPMVRSVKKGK